MKKSIRVNHGRGGVRNYGIVDKVPHGYRVFPSNGVRGCVQPPRTDLPDGWLPLAKPKHADGYKYPVYKDPDMSSLKCIWVGNDRDTMLQAARYGGYTQADVFNKLDRAHLHGAKQYWKKMSRIFKQIKWEE